LVGSLVTVTQHEFETESISSAMRSLQSAGADALYGRYVGTQPSLAGPGDYVRDLQDNDRGMKQRDMQ
jgi:hypothetical protein